MDERKPQFEFTTTGAHDHQPGGVRAMGALEKAAESRAWQDEIRDERVVIYDHHRVLRRARQIEAELAPTMLSPQHLAEWKEWRLHRLVPGASMRKGMDA